MRIAWRRGNRLGKQSGKIIKRGNFAVQSLNQGGTEGWISDLIKYATKGLILSDYGIQKSRHQ